MNTELPKGSVYDCIYYRGDNSLDVIRFCGGKAHIPSIYNTTWPPIYITASNGCCYTAPVGSYIVKDGNSFVVYDEQSFEQQFHIYRGGIVD